MNLNGRSYTGNVFSWNDIRDSHFGREKLARIFRLLFENSEALVVMCERPLLNRSAKECISFKKQFFSNVELDDFMFSFNAIRRNLDIAEVISLLIEYFYFFEQISFVFLEKHNDYVRCEKFLKNQKDWRNITNNFVCRFAYKSVEDDVLWCRASFDFIWGGESPKDF